MECRLAGETEVLGENLPNPTFVHHKIPHDKTRVWTRTAAVESRRLTAWAMARPYRSFFYFFITRFCEAIGTAATPGLLCQPRVIVKMIVEKQVECRLAGETEVLGENLPQRHFCPSQNPTWPDPGLNPGSRSGKPATNRLSYGAALPARSSGKFMNHWLNTFRDFLMLRTQNVHQLLLQRHCTISSISLIEFTHTCYLLEINLTSSST
jgi:hypothetical protein